MNEDKKRGANRIEILGELRGEVKVYMPMSVTEISRRGGQVETAFPLQVDSLHEFRLTLGEHSVVVKARIAHCRISDVDQEVVRYRAGIEFADLSERVEAAIAQFIESIQAARRL